MSAWGAQIKRKLQSRRGVFVVLGVICVIFRAFCLVVKRILLNLHTEKGDATICSPN